MAKQLRVLIEFERVPDLELLESLGFQILNQSQLFPIVTALGTKDQIGLLSESPLVKSIDISPEITIDPV